MHKNRLLQTFLVILCQKHTYIWCFSQIPGATSFSPRNYLRPYVKNSWYIGKNGKKLCSYTCNISCQQFAEFVFVFSWGIKCCLLIFYSKTCFLIAVLCTTSISSSKPAVHGTTGLREWINLKMSFPRMLR